MFENEHYLDAIDYDLLNIYDATKIVDATQKEHQNFWFTIIKIRIVEQDHCALSNDGGTANAHKFNGKIPET